MHKIPFPELHISVGWYPLDMECVATCLEIPGLSGLGVSPEDAIAELTTAIRAWLEYQEGIGS